MTWAAFFSLIGFHFVGMASPGPDLFLVLRYATKSRKHALAAVAGVSTGAAMWIMLTVFGLAAVLKASPSLMAGIQLLGGAYLVYMAVSMLRGGIKTLLELRSGAEPAFASAMLGSLKSAYRTGVLTNLSNPKIVLFLAAVLSQFVPVDAPMWILLACAFALIVTQIFFFSSMAVLISTEIVMRRLVLAGPWIDIVAGVLFAVMGVIFISAGLQVILTS